MKFYISLVLVILAFGQSLGKTKPTWVKVLEVKQLIRNLFNSNPPQQARALRLAFHGCVGGKCDGCLNFGLPSNKGLTTIVNDLENILTNPTVNPYFSRADLWSLAGIVAVEEGVKLSNIHCKALLNAGKTCPQGIMPHVKIPFKWGRVDCNPLSASTSTIPANGFPTGNMEGPNMFNWFDKEFGFTKEEVTALMGAHSLGKATLANSGYKGPWTKGQEKFFNNLYFKNMISRTIEFRNQANFPSATTLAEKKFQFNMFNLGGCSVGMMLHTDMSLAFDFTRTGRYGSQCMINNFKAKGDCFRKIESPQSMLKFKIRNEVDEEVRRIPAGDVDIKPPRPVTCVKASTFNNVKKYADNPLAFMKDFAAVFLKMIGHGYSNLEIIRPELFRSDSRFKMAPMAQRL